MTETTSAFVHFRTVLARHIRDLERSYPEWHTTPWFFLRYLRRVARPAFGTDSPRACNPAMRGLVRFYCDAIEPGGDLAWRFEEVLDAHRTALRLERRE